ncbi:hypothetical protein CEXT_114611 [Caerostris extrusa]|uniref:Uncharacterized protein n=1 Tax=Caerostris extrusa TaxID=172846 RepID=A0AAV4X3K9_CAEEX|nr:hypothetical protein CEXT_114611 [Caerostris extrusa]
MPDLFERMINAECVKQEPSERITHVVNILLFANSHRSYQLRHFFLSRKISRQEIEHGQKFLRNHFWTHEGPLQSRLGSCGGLLDSGGGARAWGIEVAA